MQNRKLTSKEKGMRDELLDTAQELGMQLPAGGPVTIPGGNMLNRPGSSGGISAGPYSLVGPHDRKDYQSLFGRTGGYEWTDKDTNFFAAVFSGRHHPGLITNSMSETVPSDGGYLVPGETASRIHAVSLE